MKTIAYIFVLMANFVVGGFSLFLFSMEPGDKMLPALVIAIVSFINLIFIFFICPPDDDDIKLKKFSIGSVLPNPFSGLGNIYPFIYFKRKRMEEEKRIAELNKE